MFHLTKDETEALRFQFGSLKQGGHFKYLPYAFTEQGVSMLSAVLNSPKAVDISIRIMRAFVKLRMILSTNDALRHRRIGAAHEQERTGHSACNKGHSVDPDPSGPAEEKIQDRIRTARQGELNAFGTTTNCGSRPFR
jgi:hypothetical protein